MNTHTMYDTLQTREWMSRHDDVSVLNYLMSIDREDENNLI